MKITPREKDVLRELAKRYAELAALPVQKERYNRARDINDLKPRRPMVWLHEIPWHEMEIDNKLKMQCKTDFAREMEWHFRSALYRWEYIQADTVLENVYYIPKSFSSTGMGVSVQNDLTAIEDSSQILCHTFVDQLDTMEKVEALHMPVITAHPEIDSQNVELAEDILNGILPVELQGHYLYHAPWDEIPRYRGVGQVLSDLAFEPELMHAIIRKFSDATFSRVRQMEELQLVDSNISNLHCTPPYVSDLKSDGPAKLKDCWYRGMAQLFTDVSPQMFEEFELNYAKPIMAEFGLVYYGCCEALDRKIPMLKTVPNLRKIGVSPWSNIEVCAEQIGKDYVFAHKPNPSHVAGVFDADVVRNEITQVIEACHKHGCPYEFAIKDITTVGNNPRNLIQWTNTVMEVIDEYYN